MGCGGGVRQNEGDEVWKVIKIKSEWSENVYMKNM
jgi:hypothetical protein